MVDITHSHTYHTCHVKHTLYAMQCLYPLLELLVDAEPVVKQAARCTLDRIALNTGHCTFATLLR